MNPIAITTVQVHQRNPGAIPIATTIIIIHHHRRLHHRLTRNTNLKVKGSTLPTLDPTTHLKRARASRPIAVEVAATRILK